MKMGFLMNSLSDNNNGHVQNERSYSLDANCFFMDDAKIKNFYHNDSKKGGNIL